MKLKLAGMALLLTSGVSAQNQIIDIPATRDNTLYESAAGDLSNGAGSHVFAGRTQDGDLRRALVAFDDLSAIADADQIESARLVLSMNRTVSGPATFFVAPVQVDWGESNSRAGGQEGGGGTAQPGDATWLHAMSPDVLWNQPGGDFDSTVAQTTVDGIGTYVFDGQDLTDLVRSWVRAPAGNLGVGILADETTDGTSAKRFSSREGANPPILQVTLAPAGEPGEPRQFAGLWFDPALDGEGYNVIQADVGTTIFFFGYGADMQRLWLVTDTRDVEFRFDEPVEFTVFFGMGGSFASPTPSAELEIWGSLVVTLTSCTEARFVLSGADGDKTSNAVKLVGVSGNECSD